LGISYKNYTNLGILLQIRYDHTIPDLKGSEKKKRRTS